MGNCGYYVKKAMHLLFCNTCLGAPDDRGVPYDRGVPDDRWAPAKTSHPRLLLALSYEHDEYGTSAVTL